MRAVVNRQLNPYQIWFVLFHSGCSRFPGRDSTVAWHASVLRKDRQQDQIPSETSDRRKARILGGFHEKSIPTDGCIGPAGYAWVGADSRRWQQYGPSQRKRLLGWIWWQLHSCRKRYS